MAPTVKRIFRAGASRGIRLAIAKALTGHGHEVWATSRDPARIPQLVRLHPARLDLSDPTSIDEGFNTALAEAGHFDVLINNAGGGQFGPAECISSEIISKQFQGLFFVQI